MENRLPMGKDVSLHGLVAIGCIFIWQNILQGITFLRWSNPDSEEYSGRDYFSVMDRCCLCRQSVLRYIRYHSD